MFYNNPFNSWNEANQSPSIYGALPYPTPQSSFIGFQFVNFNPTTGILNCSVVGSAGDLYYRIVTDDQMPGYTVIKNKEGKNVALIEWQAHPLIEIRGVLAKQYVKTWLGVNQDKSARIMTLRGTQYSWTPREKSIYLYSRGADGPQCLAKVTRNTSAVNVEMAPDAIQLGLLDATVAASLLLLCGRNID